jgi:LAO/AO transport system kinase
MKQIDIEEAIRNRDKRVMARLITLIEDRDEEAIEVIKKVYRKAGKAWVIGVTGPAGVGKSTLLDCLIDQFRKEDKMVGVIAIDPTSPFSGGAILADRIRMQLHSVDEGVFIRSMGTRGRLGGVSAATSDVVDLLDAFGMDVIIIETVGVGQDEIDIVKIAHSVIVVLMPGMGDEIQVMKAGLMEIGDIFVINKSDREGVERLQTELEMLLGLATFDGGWVPKIVKTIATKKIGVDKLTEKLKEHRDYLYSANLLMIKGLQAAKQRFLDAYQELSLAKVISKNCEAEFQDILKSIYERKIDPYTAAEIFLKK